MNVIDTHILEKLKAVLRREANKADESAMMVAEDEVPYMTKDEILANFDQACKELKLNLEGKLEFKDAEELLNEL